MCWGSLILCSWGDRILYSNHYLPWQSVCFVCDPFCLFPHSAISQQVDKLPQERVSLGTRCNYSQEGRPKNTLYNAINVHSHRCKLLTSSRLNYVKQPWTEWCGKLDQQNLGIRFFPLRVIFSYISQQQSIIIHRDSMNHCSPRRVNGFTIW